MQNSEDFPCCFTIFKTFHLSVNLDYEIFAWYNQSKTIFKENHMKKFYIGENKYLEQKVLAFIIAIMLAIKNKAILILSII